MADLMEGIKKWTSTSLFLVRGLGLNIIEMKKMGYVNAYIDDIDHEPHYKESVYLLFKPSDIEEFQFFHLSEAERTPLLVEDYDYEGGYIVLVYNFPEQYLHEYNLFLNGQYSYFRKRYTDMFPEEIEIKTAYNIVKQKSIYYHVFNRTEELKKIWEDRLDVQFDDETEYWSIPDIGKETLNISKIKEMQKLVYEE